MLPLRSASGRSASASVERGAPRCRSPPTVVFVLVTRSVEVGAALGDRRHDARGVLRGGRERALVGETSLMSRPCRDRRVEVLHAPGLASSPLPRTSARALRRTAAAPCASGSSVSKSWSMSTIGCVSVPIHRAVLELGASSSARASARCSGWRRPTARSRGSIGAWCPRAAARRRPRRGSSPRPACCRQLEVLDGPTRLAADLDLAALDELAGVLEAQPVLACPPRRAGTTTRDGDHDQRRARRAITRAAAAVTGRPHAGAVGERGVLRRAG